MNVWFYWYSCLCFQISWFLEIFRLMSLYTNPVHTPFINVWYMDRVKQIWYLSPMRAAKVHPRSLARTSPARSYKQWVKRNLQTESQIPGLSEWLGMRGKNLSWTNARRHKFAWRRSHVNCIVFIPHCSLILQSLFVITCAHFRVFIDCCMPGSQGHKSSTCRQQRLRSDCMCSLLAVWAGH